MKKSIICFLLAITLGIPSFAEQPKHEFRATWLATVSGIDWPKTKATSDSTREQQKQELINILDKMKAGNMNAVCMQVRSMSDAMYVSSHEPWSAALTGTRGKDPGYDPLQFAIDEAHKRGMELHVWVNPFRVGTVSTSDVIWSNAGDWLIKYNNEGSFTGYIIDPGYPESRAYVVKVLMEIVNNYDIDGIVMDDYFYAYGGTTNEDAKAQTKHYNPSDVTDVNGNGSTLDDWRRSNVDKVIKAMYDSIQTVKPWVRFGMGPGGIWTMDHGAARAYGLKLPAGISGGDIYNGLYCNTVEWVKGGYVDYVNPQIYWSTQVAAQDFDVLCEWWAKSVCEHFSDQLPDGKRVHFFPSTAAYKVYNGSTGFEDGVKEMERQMDATRTHLSSGYAGAVHYNTTSYLKMYEDLAKSHYIYEALTPPMEWKVQDSLAAPSNLKLSGTTLTWQHPTAERFTIYTFPKGFDATTAMQEAKYLHGIVYGNTCSLEGFSDLGNITIAVCAYDRYGVEHAAAIFNEGSFPESDPNATEITWVLNGGEVTQYVVPTNVELWDKLKPDYVKFYTDMYGESFVPAEDRTIEDILGFTWINSLSKGLAMDFMLQDPAWTWLSDYMTSVADKQGYDIDSDNQWRYHLYSFFNCTNAAYRIDGYKAGNTADFSTEGQPEKWGKHYDGTTQETITLPTQVDDTYILPTPTHPEGWDFLGWYTTPDFTSDRIYVIPAGWKGTLYANWDGYIPPTNVENVLNPQLPMQVFDVMGRQIGNDVHQTSGNVVIIKQGNNTFKHIK